MAIGYGQKYIVATTDNNFQISVRNILNPKGFCYITNIDDSKSLLRFVRSYAPDFIIIDMSFSITDIRPIIETIDDENICLCIIAGNEKDVETLDIMEKSKSLSFCYKEQLRETIITCVELGLLYHKRLAKLEKKVKELAESYETRKAVEKAKWILIQKNSISEEEAYQRMRKKSMDMRMTMREIAEAIICAYEVTK